MLILAAAGLAEMEPGDAMVLEALFWAGVIVCVLVIALFMAGIFMLIKAYAALETREQRRSRTSKSLFEVEHTHDQRPSEV